MSAEREADEAGNANLSDDLLEGVDAIALFLGAGWTSKRVRQARFRGLLPIRRKSPMGIYAFKSELVAALRSPDTLSSAALRNIDKGLVANQIASKVGRRRS